MFINNQLVSTAELANMNLDAGNRIRLMPGLVGGQHPLTFVVQITDQSGHSEVVMTKAQIVDKATQNNELWVFVNNQLVNTNDLAEMNMEAGSSVRMAPGIIGGQDAPTFDVEIADATGHSTVQMTQDELVEKADQTQGSWVFVDNQLVSTAEIANMNVEAGSRIRLMPGLIGGRAC